MTDIPLSLIDRLMPLDIVSPRICSKAFARSTELGVLKRWRRRGHPDSAWRNASPVRVATGPIAHCPRSKCGYRPRRQPRDSQAEEQCDKKAQQLWKQTLDSVPFRLITSEDICSPRRLATLTPPLLRIVTRSCCEPVTNAPSERRSATQTHDSEIFLPGRNLT